MSKYQLWMQHWEVETSHWSDGAACSDADPELFTIIERGSKRAARMTDLERLDLNKENHEDAKSYCDRCPVLDACLANASQDDLEWTVRAGRSPLMFTGLTPGRPVRRSETYRSNICGQGHYREIGKKCKRCENDRQVERRQRERENRQAYLAGLPLPHPPSKRKKNVPY